jgi:hypothetical protein
MTPSIVLTTLKEELDAIIKSSETTERTLTNIRAERERLKALSLALERNNFTLRQTVYELEAGRPREKASDFTFIKCQKRVSTWRWD